MIRGHLFIGSRKSEASKPMMGLPDFVVTVIQYPWNKAEYYQLVFRTRTNTPILTRNLLRHFHQTLEKLIIAKVRFYSLRHYFRDVLNHKKTARSGYQALVGLSSFQITYNNYSHLLLGYQHEAARKIDRLV
jgi:integrase